MNEDLQVIRDGAPIEVTALVYKSVIRLSEVFQEHGLNEYLQVSVNGHVLSLKQWARKIQLNFDQFYWIPENGSDYIDRCLIKKWNIYKDTAGSNIPTSDFQLRPNFILAYKISPELFQEHHIFEALTSAW